MRKTYMYGTEYRLHFKLSKPIRPDLFERAKEYAQDNFHYGSSRILVKIRQKNQSDGTEIALHFTSIYNGYISIKVVGDTINTNTVLLEYFNMYLDVCKNDFSKFTNHKNFSLYFEDLANFDSMKYDIEAEKARLNGKFITDVLSDDKRIHFIFDDIDNIYTYFRGRISYYR